MKNRKLLGHVFALLSVILWGTSFIVSKNLMETVSPVQLMWLRFVIAYIALWILHPRWYFNTKDELMFLLISLFANTLYFLTENTALKLTQTSNVSILVTTAPIFAAVILRLFGKSERITGRQLLGFAVAFAGVILVVFNGVINLRLSPKGDLLALAAAFSWAVYGTLVRRSSEKFNSFLITRKLMFYGIITSFPILVSENAQFEFSTIFSTANILSLLYLGVICSAICYMMWNSAIKQIGVLKTNIYMYAVPMVTLIAGAVFLNETVTLLGVAGIVLVIIGMALSNLKEAKKE